MHMRFDIAVTASDQQCIVLFLSVNTRLVAKINAKLTFMRMNYSRCYCYHLLCWCQLQKSVELCKRLVQARKNGRNEMKEFYDTLFHRREANPVDEISKVIKERHKVLKTT